MSHPGTKLDLMHGRSVNRRSLVKGAGAFALASGLPALHIARTSAQAKVEGKLTLVYMGTVDQQKAWTALFDLFRKTYPNIDLKAQGIPSTTWASFFDNVSTQIAGGKVPDLIQVATEGQRLFASRGLVEPIDDMIERDKAEIDEFYSDIDPNLVKWNKEHSSPDGKTYYLPGEFNTMCMWYSASAFKKAGVEEPTDAWTWDEFNAACDKIVASGAYAYAAGNGYFAGVMPWLLTNGASSMSADWTKATINTPEAIEAATLMQEMVKKKVSPGPGGTFDVMQSTKQGKLAMFGGGRWPIIDARRLGFVDDMKIVAWPQKTQKGSPCGWNAYPIMKGTKNKEAAWAFVKFLTTKEASTYFAEQGGTIVPPRKSVANSPAFLDNAPAGSEKLYEALSYSVPIPSPDKGNVIQKDIEDTFNQILAGNVKPDEALNKLNDKIQANL
jgi:multiple sugar transport system substrate-binding protein